MHALPKRVVYEPFGFCVALQEPFVGGTFNHLSGLVETTTSLCGALECLGCGRCDLPDRFSLLVAAEHSVLAARPLFQVQGAYNVSSMGSQLLSPNSEAAIWARLMQAQKDELSSEAAIPASD